MHCNLLILICFLNLIIFIGLLDTAATNRLSIGIIAMLRSKKKRLIESGVDSEELRLYCRSLSGRLNHHAERRLEIYRKNLK